MDKDDKTLSRREFFKTAGLSAGAAGVAVAAAGGSAGAAEPVKKNAAGYRETEHVRKYYDLASS